MYLAVYNSCLEILDHYKHHARQEEFQQGAEKLITTAVKFNQLKAVKRFLDYGITQGQSNQNQFPPETKWHYQDLV